MPEDKFTESFELALDAESFISGINRVVRQYDTSINNMTKLSMNLGKDIGKINEQVLKSVQGLSIRVSRDISGTFESAKQSFNAINSEIKDLRSSAIKDLEEITKQTSLLAKMKDSRVKQIGKKVEEGKLSPEKATEKIQGEIDSYNKLISKAEARAKGTLNNFLGNISSFGTATISEITNLSNAAFTAVMTSTAKLDNRLDKLRKNINSSDINTAIAGVKSAKPILDNIKKEHEQNNRDLIVLDKQRAEVLKQVHILEANFRAQTDKQLKQEALKNYTQALNYLKEFDDMADKVRERQATISEYTKKMAVDVERTRGKLSKEVTQRAKKPESDLSDALDQQKATIKYLNMELTDFGNIGEREAKRVAKDFVDLNSYIDAGVNDLKKYVKILDEMGKEGDENAKKSSKNLQESISLIQKEQNEYKKTFDTINKLSNLKSTNTFDEVIKKLNDSAHKMREELVKNRKAFRSTDLTSAMGIAEGFDYWKKVELTAKKSAVVVEDIKRKISDKVREYNELILKSDMETDKLAMESYRSKAEFVKKQISELERTERRYRAMSIADKGIKDKIDTSTGKEIQKIKDTAIAWSQVEHIINRLKSEYDVIIDNTNKYSAANIRAAKMAENSISILKTGFVKNREEIKQAIRDLNNLSRTGTVETKAQARIQIQELGKLLAEYQKHYGDVRSIAAGTAKRIDSQEAELSKTRTKRIMEYVRNIRWQYAAMAYLVRESIQFVNAAFFGTLREADEFRRGIYSIVASIGLSFGEAFKDSFGTIYDYSRSIMERLQAKIATTYVTLEDAKMVLQSFAQAGIFPKTDEDVDRIVTLSTAVKVMTEGMANAGVQMRQEIMALIEGRARVTDTIAKAFKLQGINLKEEMANWEKEGISKLEGFARILKPFEEINRKIGDEYGAQVNNLKEMWNYIKRIAAEPLLMKIASDIKSFVASLGIVGKDLTERGKALAFLIRTLLDSTWETGKVIGKVFVGILELVGNIVGKLTGLDQVMPRFKSNSDGVAQLFIVMGQSVATIAGGFQITLAYVKDMLDVLSKWQSKEHPVLEFITETSRSRAKNSLAKIFGESNLPDVIKKKLIGALKGTEEELSKIEKSRALITQGKNVSEVDKALLNVVDTLTGLKAKLDQVGQSKTFEELAGDMNRFLVASINFDKLKELETKMEKLRKKAMSPTEEVIAEYEKEKEGLDVLQEEYTKAIKEITRKIEDFNSSVSIGEDASSGIRNQMQAALGIVKDALKDVNQLQEDNTKTRDKRLEEIEKKRQSTFRDLYYRTLDATYSDIENFFNDYEKLAEEVNEKVAEGMSKTFADILNQAALTRFIKNTDDAINKVYNEVKKAGLEGAAKIKFELEVETNSIQKSRSQLEEFREQIQASYTDLFLELADQAFPDDELVARLELYETILIKIDEMLTALGFKMKAANDEANKQIADSMQKTAKQAADNLLEYQNFVREMMDDITDPVTKAMYELEKRFENIRAKSADNPLFGLGGGDLEKAALAEFIRKSELAFSQVIQNQEDLISRLTMKENNLFIQRERNLEDFNRNINTLAEQLATAEAFLSSEFMQIMSTQSPETYNVYVYYLNKIIEKLNQAKDALKSYETESFNLAELQSLKQYYSLRSKVLDIEKEYFDVYGSIAEQRTIQLKEFQQQLDIYATDYKETLESLKQYEGSEYYDSMLASATDYYNKVTELTKMRMKDLQSIFMQYGEHFRSFFSDIFEGIFDAINGKMDSIKDALMNLLSGIRKQASEEIGSSIWSAIRNKISGGNVFTTGASGATSIMDKVFGGQKTLDAMVAAGQPIPVLVTNMTGAGSITEAITDQNKALAESTSGSTSSGGFFSGLTSIFENISYFVKNLFTGLFNILKGAFSGIGSLFGMGGGGFGGIGTGLKDIWSGILGAFGWGGAFAEGGKMPEPMIGKGLRSGRIYTLNENNDEYIIPSRKMGGGNNITQIVNNNYHTNIHAIEPQSFETYLYKSRDKISMIVAKDHKQNGITRRLRG